MLSKLLPRNEADGARPFTYRALGGPGGNQQAQGGPSALPKSDAHETIGRLEARVAELENALSLAGQQLPAARQAAYREGEASGRVQAEAAVKPVIERLVRSIQDLIETKTRLRKQLEEEAVHLSLAIAKRILHRELSADPSALHGIVQVAFERVGRQEITRVVTHPDQAPAVREALTQITTRKIEVLPDGAREKGTVIFETTRGAIDASVDSQLQEIELGLADRLKWR